VSDEAEAAVTLAARARASDIDIADRKKKLPFGTDTDTDTGTEDLMNDFFDSSVTPALIETHSNDALVVIPSAAAPAIAIATASATATTSVSFGSNLKSSDVGILPDPVLAHLPSPRRRVDPPHRDRETDRNKDKDRDRDRDGASSGAPAGERHKSEISSLFLPVSPPPPPPLPLFPSEVRDVDNGMKHRLGPLPILFPAPKFDSGTVTVIGTDAVISSKIDTGKVDAIYVVDRERKHTKEIDLNKISNRDLFRNRHHKRDIGIDSFHEISINQRDPKSKSKYKSAPVILARTRKIDSASLYDSQSGNQRQQRAASLSHLWDILLRDQGPKDLFALHERLDECIRAGIYLFFASVDRLKPKTLLVVFCCVFAISLCVLLFAAAAVKNRLFRVRRGLERERGGERGIELNLSVRNATPIAGVLAAAATTASTTTTAATTTTVTNPAAPFAVTTATTATTGAGGTNNSDKRIELLRLWNLTRSESLTSLVTFIPVGSDPGSRTTKTVFDPRRFFNLRSVTASSGATASSTELLRFVRSPRRKQEEGGIEYCEIDEEVPLLGSDFNSNIESV